MAKATNKRKPEGGGAGGGIGGARVTGNPYGRSTAKPRGGSSANAPAQKPKGPSPARVKAIRQDRADQMGNLREYQNRNEPLLSNKAQAKRDKNDLGRGVAGAPRDKKRGKASASIQRQSNVLMKDAIKKGDFPVSPRPKGVSKGISPKLKSPPIKRKGK